MIGAIVNKLEPHGDVLRGYIAMLAVEKEYRHLGVGERRAASERCAVRRTLYSRMRFVSDNFGL